MGAQAYRDGIRIHKRHLGESEALCGRRVPAAAQALGPLAAAALDRLLCDGCRVAEALPAYSFCESVGASASSQVHIRLLGPSGKHLSGGADTPSLCGGIQPAWDVPGPVDDRAVAHESTCPRCRNVWNRRRGA